MAECASKAALVRLMSSRSPGESSLQSPASNYQGRPEISPRYVPDLDNIEMPSRDTFRAEW